MPSNMMQFNGRYFHNFWLHCVSYCAGCIMLHFVVELVFTDPFAGLAGNYQPKLCSSTRILMWREKSMWYPEQCALYKPLTRAPLEMGIHTLKSTVISNLKVCGLWCSDIMNLWYYKLLISRCRIMIQPTWLSWQGESGIHWQLFDLDCVGSIPAIPPKQNSCFVDHFNKLEWWCRTMIS